MNIELHSYEPIDKLYIWDTYTDSMKDYIEKIWGWDDGWQKNDFETGFDRYETKILKLDQSKIGYIQFKCEPQETYISMLVIEPMHQSMGVGTKLLEILQPSSPNGSLRLNCFTVNKGAYRFYLKCGFKILKMDDNFIYFQRYNKHNNKIRGKS